MGTVPGSHVKIVIFCFRFEKSFHKRVTGEVGKDGKNVI